MNLMTAEALFCFNYLTEVLPSFKISLNLSSWNGHITPSLTETIYQAPFSLMCLQRQLVMEQTLKIFRVIKIIGNHFTNLLAIILLFVIKPVRFHL